MDNGQQVEVSRAHVHDFCGIATRSERANPTAVLTFMAHAAISREMAGCCCVSRPTATVQSLASETVSSFSLLRHRHELAVRLSMDGRNVQRKKFRSCIRMGLRAVESYDASFSLNPECDQQLRSLLSSQQFCAQVANQAGGQNATMLEFSGVLFQPVPWSPSTKHGMPQEYEKYLHDKENFAIINVPPNFMFQAKIFKPSRLCAVYKKFADLKLD